MVETSAQRFDNSTKFRIYKGNNMSNEKLTKCVCNNVILHRVIFRMFVYNNTLSPNI